MFYTGEAQYDCTATKARPVIQTGAPWSVQGRYLPVVVSIELPYSLLIVPLSYKGDR